jgi:polysaccharide export outer membrane protein
VASKEGPFIADRQPRSAVCGGVMRLCGLKRFREWSQKMVRVIVALAVGVALACGVAQAEPVNSAPTSAQGPKATALPPEAAASYRLGAGDKLHIITFDEAQLTGDFYVGSDGKISLPMIGDVPARGRTESELRYDIEARLKDGYILNPTVSVQVLVYRPFYILGEVNKPGEYPYTDGLTVMRAVATAGGFTYRANTKRVFIKRPGQNLELKTPVTATTEVRAGDTIRVVERYF